MHTDAQVMNHLIVVTSAIIASLVVYGFDMLKDSNIEVNLRQISAQLIKCIDLSMPRATHSMSEALGYLYFEMIYIYLIEVK